MGMNKENPTSFEEMAKEMERTEPDADKATEPDADKATKEVTEEVTDNSETKTTV